MCTGSILTPPPPSALLNEAIPFLRTMHEVMTLWQLYCGYMYEIGVLCRIDCISVINSGEKKQTTMK